jgi:hypothetical protein
MMVSQEIDPLHENGKVARQGTLKVQMKVVNNSTSRSSHTCFFDQDSKGSWGLISYLQHACIVLDQETEAIVNVVLSKVHSLHSAY